MSASHLQFALTNISTIENFNKKKKVWQLAVFMPNHVRPISNQPSLLNKRPYFTITYPLDNQPKSFISGSSNDEISQGQHGSNTRSNRREVLSERDAQAFRTFAVLKTEPGTNPWDLGPMGNWRSLMGNNVLEWVLPIKRSPFCNHESTDSYFPLGPAIQKLRAAHEAEYRSSISIAQTPAAWTSQACPTPNGRADVELQNLDNQAERPSTLIPQG
jgi:palmitoyltransferase